MNDIADFLSMTPNDTPQSVVLPEGSYDFVIKSYRSDRVGQNETPLVIISVKAVGVIQSDLEEGQLENAESTRLQFWVTPNAMKLNNPASSLKMFVTQTLDMDSDIPYNQSLEMAIGQTFSGVVKHEMVGKNKDILQASISRIINK
tara:strand:- start:427 stop:864 length:438 start_codon:yes stop_codon:yes gene_type:complete